MKRYKDCTLMCINGELPKDLLERVNQFSIAEEYKTELYSAFENNDSLSVWLNEKNLPQSRLVVSTNNDLNGVSVVNIVPTQESGVSQIAFKEYNRLLDIYRANVFNKIKSEFGNEICETEESYALADIIPNSYGLLDNWLSGYPLSGHFDDEQRWFAFIISLHKNNETLSFDDFEKYIQEEYGWEEDVILDFYKTLESQIGLLKYYDEHGED